MAAPTASSTLNNPSHSDLHNAVVDVQMFDADPTGVADSTAEIQAAYDELPSEGGTLVIPPGDYLIGTGAVQLLFNNTGRTTVLAYGATFKTPAATAVAGLLLRGNRQTICGLTIDQTGNASMTAGFEFKGNAPGQGGGNHVLKDCQVFGTGPFSANFACFYVHEATLGDDSTGSFWNRFDHCSTQLVGGATKFPYGYLLEGGANHQRIVDGAYQSCVTFLKIQDGGSGILPDAILITDADISGVTTCFHIAGTGVGAGFAVAFCRFEVVGTVLQLGTISAGIAHAPTLLFNQYIGAPTTAFITNPNSYDVNALEPWATPDLGAESMKLFTQTNPLRLYLVDAVRLRTMVGTTEIGRIDGSGSYFTINDSTGNGVRFTGTRLGFFSATPTTKPAALTAAATDTVDATYGTEESTVIANLRTRLNQLETKLQTLGLLA